MPAILPGHPGSISLPILLRESMEDFGEPAVESWWDSLDDRARADVIQLWQDTAGGEVCGARVEGRFVEDDAENPPLGLWSDDFYEYLVNHEVFLLDLPGVHICSQQPEARAAIRAGFVSKDFACAIDRGPCPMHRLLQFASGKSVRLQLAFVRKASGSAIEP